jgi:hypothetical protein
MIRHLDGSSIYFVVLQRAEERAVAKEAAQGVIRRLDSK